METEIADKKCWFLWFSQVCVSCAPQNDGCVRLPQIVLAWLTRLAYQAHVLTPTTKESHMNKQLCAFTRGTVCVGTTWGMYRA